jgi:hypothetical protein
VPKNSVSRCGWWSVTESKNIIACHPYPGKTEEEARTARARAWSYIFSCYEKHKAVEAQDGDVEAGSFVERHARELGHANYRNRRR